MSRETTRISPKLQAQNVGLMFCAPLPSVQCNDVRTRKAEMELHMMMRLLALLLVATLLVSNVNASVPSVARTCTPHRTMQFEYWVRCADNKRRLHMKPNILLLSMWYSMQFLPNELMNCAR